MDLLTQNNPLKLLVKIPNLFSKKSKAKSKRNFILRDMRKVSKGMRRDEPQYYYMNIKKYNSTTKQMEESNELIVKI